MNNGQLKFPFCSKLFLSLPLHIQRVHHLSKEQFIMYKIEHPEICVVSSYFCENASERMTFYQKEKAEELKERKKLLLNKSNLFNNCKYVSPSTSSFVREQLKLLKIDEEITIDTIAIIADSYTQHLKDDFVEEGREETKKEIENLQLELKVLQLENVKVLRLSTQLNFCLRSGKTPNSEHHIIPREFEKEYGHIIFELPNILMLEKRTHDQIETQTKDYMQQHKRVTISDLVNKIYFGFPGEDFEKIDSNRIEGIQETLILKGLSQEDSSAYAPVINNMLSDKVKVYSKITGDDKWFMVL
jgi:AraC-like DNA-binding protein